MVLILVVFFAAGILRVFFRFLGRILHFFLRQLLDAGLLIGSLVWLLMLFPGAFFATLFGGMAGARRTLRQMGRALWTSAATLGRLLFGNLGAVFVGGTPWPTGPGHTQRPLPKAPPVVRTTDSFAAYHRLGTLPSGGSGALLEIAKPTPEKLAEFQAAGFPSVDRVVLKSFPLEGGPSLAQIMRESRSLEVARRLGFVLEHGVDEQRFWYVMPYVPGQNLRQVVEGMHANKADGLAVAELRRGVSYVSDLLLGLERFHQAGLWHKDVKPDNLVVCGERAHLVDLGLVTPLESGMTLTTHGTEYFRDPEMVRMAMKGTKVREVEAAKFDLFGAGAVLYSVIEGEFPAHGVLSRLTKTCPEALRMIVRKSMAEMGERYADVRTMLLDIHKVLEADDPYALTIADLPSMGGRDPVGLGTEPPPLQEYRPLVHHESRGSSTPPLVAKQAASAFPSRRQVLGTGLGILLTGFASLLSLAAFTPIFHNRAETVSGIPGAPSLQWGETELMEEPLLPESPRQPHLLVLDDWNPSRDIQKAEQLAGLWGNLVQKKNWIPVGEAGTASDVDREMCARIRASQGIGNLDDSLTAALSVLASESRYGGLLWLKPTENAGEVAADCLSWPVADAWDLEMALDLP